MDIGSVSFFIFLTVIEAGAITFVPILIDKHLYIWLLVPFILLVIGRVCWFLGLFAKKNIYRIILQLMHCHFNFPEDHSVRCTLLVPSPIRKILIQKARFGDDISRSKIPLGKGVAGECFTTGKSIIEVVKGDFYEYMIKRGFTLKEARQFKPKESYLCVPIKKGKNDPNPPLGVISLDSTKGDTFKNLMMYTIENDFIPHIYELLSERR